MNKKSSYKSIGITLFLFLIFLALRLTDYGRFSWIGESESSRKFVDYLIQIGFWLTAAAVIDRLLKVFFWDRIVNRAVSGSVPRLLRDLGSVLVFVAALGVIIGLVFNQPLTAFWTTSGLLGLILGFALRNMILDLFTGIALHIDRPFVIGDWIEIHRRGASRNLLGQIQEINWRTVRLRTEEDTLIVVPNNMLGTMVIENYWESTPAARFETKITIDFSVSPERVERILSTALNDCCFSEGFLREPEPQVLVSDTSELGIEYKLRYWITPWKNTSPSRAESVVLKTVIQHLTQAGISPAYPKEDIYYAEMPERHQDPTSAEGRYALVSRLRLFRHLKDRELEFLSQHMTSRSFNAGESVINCGENGDSMYVLYNGLLEVFVPGSSLGEMVQVAQISPGQFFGEMSLLTGEPRSATIKAITRSSCFEISKQHILTILKERPEIGESLSRIAAERRLQNQLKLDELSAEEIAEETRSTANRIYEKMKTFFLGIPFVKH